MWAWMMMWVTLHMDLREKVDGPSCGLKCDMNGPSCWLEWWYGWVLAPWLEWHSTKDLISRHLTPVRALWEWGKVEVEIYYIMRGAWWWEVVQHMLLAWGGVWLKCTTSMQHSGCRMWQLMAACNTVGVTDDITHRHMSCSSILLYMT